MYLAPEPSQRLDDWCPHFIQPLLLELYEQVRGMDFYAPAASDGLPHISMFDRSTEEICELVDWTCSIWMILPRYSRTQPDVQLASVSRA